ncbi:unnamed protein product, partial [Vitrella brassicaformis CCMP3155]
KCLVHRGCSKAFDFLRIEVHRSDCLDLLLSNFATFKALASLIDTTCSPSAKVDCSIISPDGVLRDISLPHLLAYTHFDFTNLPSCSLPLVNALLSAYKVRLDSSHSHIDCPKFETSGPGLSRPCHYVWRVTQDQLQGAISDIGRERMSARSSSSPGGGVRPAVFPSTVRRVSPLPLMPSHQSQPPELKALNRVGVERVRTLIVNHRIGLGVAKTILSEGAHLTELQLTGMGPTDVLGLLVRVSVWKMPRHLVLNSLQPRAPHPHVPPGLSQRLQKVKMLTAKGDVALRFATALTQHMHSSLDTLAMSGGETEMRQVLVNGGCAAIDELYLGYVSEGRYEFIKAEDEREGITLGDHKDQMPHIKKLVMHLDVPSADVVDSGAFILSSIWSVLEIESISQLTVVLNHRFQLDELKGAVLRRFAPPRKVSIIIHSGPIRSMGTCVSNSQPMISQCCAERRLPTRRRLTSSRH